MVNPHPSQHYYTMSILNHLEGLNSHSLKKLYNYKGKVKKKLTIKKEDMKLGPWAKSTRIDSLLNEGLWRRS